MIHQIKKMRKFFSYFANLGLRLPPFFFRKNDAQHICNLRKYGFYTITPEESIKRIEWLQDLINLFSSPEFNIEENKSASVSEQKDYRVILTGLISDKIKESISRDSFFSEIAQTYFGFNPVLRYASIWLDRPTPANEKETQTWHRDYDDVFLLKVFIYLNDVEIGNGPFCYVPGSHRRPWLPSPRKAGLVYKNEVKLKGRAGSVIFADTLGLHKGLKPEIGKRILLTLNFTSQKPISTLLDSPWQ